MTLDGRALRLLVLGSWSTFLCWLWLSGEVARYLGPRTSWVVTIGGLALAAATVGYGYLTRGGGGDGLRPARRELAGAAALLTPIVLGAVLANASLGAQAASQKLTARGVDVTALAKLQGSGGGIGLLDIRAAGEDHELAAETGIRPGRGVHLIGFVSKAATKSGGPFELSRFYITCCVADSIPIAVTVLPPKRVAATAQAGRDHWLSVTGVLAKRGKGYVVDGEQLRAIPEPAHPYLAFAR